jgi:hypothetical protein
MIYTIYDPATGQIQHTITSHDPVQLEQNLLGRSHVPGEFHSTTHMIVSGEPVAKPPQPDEPGLSYVFDYAARSWVLDVGRSSTLSRQLRNSLLASVDQINPVWFNSLTTQQQTELAEYRQALLDVPQQSGFPTQVNWPAKPTWI